ncbi:hypothetical protein RUM44_013727 [Polyplax serrata]|uniref:Uncharacterized protein n=1 Tax=Polyplax serrata TaxID=468196 RepID=A0ABR1BGV2_POLSC
MFAQITQVGVCGQDEILSARRLDRKTDGPNKTKGDQLTPVDMRACHGWMCKKRPWTIGGLRYKSFCQRRSFSRSSTGTPDVRYTEDGSNTLKLELFLIRHKKLFY